MILKTYQRVFLSLLVVLFLTCLISPWATAGWDAIRSAIPEWENVRYPFSRIFNRLFMVLAIILFLIFRRFLKIGPPSQLGLTSFRQGYGDLLTGFPLALISFVVVVVIMTLTGVFWPELRLTFEEGSKRSMSAILAAVTVGFLEEVFFRGIIFKGLLEDWKPTGAFIGANLFYSAIHFVRPAQTSTIQGFDPLLGFKHLAHTFEPFSDPVGLFPGLFGLFLLGIVLSYAFIRTGSLYLSIGLHAGWVFGIKTIKVYGNYTREGLGWLFGSTDPKFVSGVATWVGFLMVGVIVYWLTRSRPIPASDPPPARAV